MLVFKGAPIGAFVVVKKGVIINTRAKINCREDEIKYLLDSLIFKKKGFLDRIKNIDKRIDELSKEYSDIKRAKDGDR